MTTTKPIAEQVGDIQDEDYALAKFTDFTIEGRCFVSSGHLFIGSNLFSICLREADGTINSDLTSITRVPRPIPSEPEVGSFALLDDGDVAQRIGGSWKYPWRKATNQDYFASWESLFPHISRLYTPSGDLVTGFEYYRAEKESQ